MFYIIITSQTCEELDKFASQMELRLNSDAVGKDLASVTALLKHQSAYKDEIEMRKQEVQELKNQGGAVGVALCLL